MKYTFTNFNTTPIDIVGYRDAAMTNPYALQMHLADRWFRFVPGGNTSMATFVNGLYEEYSDPRYQVVFFIRPFLFDNWYSLGGFNTLYFPCESGWSKRFSITTSIGFDRSFLISEYFNNLIDWPSISDINPTGLTFEQGLEYIDSDIVDQRIYNSLQPASIDLTNNTISNFGITNDSDFTEGTKYNCGIVFKKYIYSDGWTYRQATNNFSCTRINRSGYYDKCFNGAFVIMGIIDLLSI